MHHRSTFPKEISTGNTPPPNTQKTWHCPRRSYPMDSNGNLMKGVSPACGRMARAGPERLCLGRSLSPAAETGSARRQGLSWRLRRRGGGSWLPPFSAPIQIDLHDIKGVREKMGKPAVRKILLACRSGGLLPTPPLLSLSDSYQDGHKGGRPLPFCPTRSDQTGRGATFWREEGQRLRRGQ